MHIVVCGSMSAARDMIEAKGTLERMGFTCTIPVGSEEYAAGLLERVGGSEGAKRKIAHNLIIGYFEEIRRGDAVLITNCAKSGIPSYIGGNAFLEMGFAHVLGKPIFLLNPIPDNPLMRQEIEAMQPIVLNGALGRIGEWLGRTEKGAKLRVAVGSTSRHKAAAVREAFGHLGQMVEVTAWPNRVRSE